MSQEDYREKIEEHRQAITIESEQETNPSRMTRRQLHGNQNKKKKKEKNRNNKLLTVLAIIFILIPVSMLVYYFGFSAKEENSGKTEVDHSSVQIETNDNTLKSATKASSKSEKHSTSKEVANKKLVEENKAMQVKKEEGKVEKAKKEDAVTEAKQQQIYNQAKASGRLYNVKQGETIQSIAMRFYGSTAGVAIIKDANGITGETVPAGTTIAIPAQ